MKRILVIEGGGIKGIAALEVLRKIEAEPLPDQYGTIKRQRISGLFDLVVGTSTGGLIAWALSVPQRDDIGTPANSAAKILEVYKTQASEIFKASWFRRRWTPRMFVPKYSAKGLKRAAEKVVGDTMIDKALCRVMTPAWNLTDAREEMFKSWKKPHPKKGEEFQMIDAALATSAAPTFFPAHTISKRQYVDGGLFANDPSPSAIAEARVMWPDEPLAVLVLDIGGGAPKMEVKKGGIFDWLKKAPTLLMGSGQSYARYLGEAMMTPKDSYFRVLCHSHGVEMDSSDPEEIETLCRLGKEAAKKNWPMIKEVLSHGL